MLCFGKAAVYLPSVKNILHLLCSSDLGWVGSGRLDFTFPLHLLLAL